MKKGEKITHIKQKNNKKSDKFKFFVAFLFYKKFTNTGLYRQKNTIYCAKRKKECSKTEKNMSKSIKKD